MALELIPRAVAKLAMWMIAADSKATSRSFTALASWNDKGFLRRHFDFVGGGFYKCGCHRNSFHDSLTAQTRAERVTTAIIRMHGKAVKFRHCPATVSAAEPTNVGSGRGQTTGVQLREGDGDTAMNNR
jgi:hypothetical protein